MKLTLLSLAAGLVLGGCVNDRSDYVSNDVQRSWDTTTSGARYAGSSVAMGTNRIVTSTGRGLQRTGDTLEAVGERTGESIHHGAEWVGEQTTGRGQSSYEQRSYK